MVPESIADIATLGSVQHTAQQGTVHRRKDKPKDAVACGLKDAVVKLEVRLDHALTVQSSPGKHIDSATQAGEIFHRSATCGPRSDFRLDYQPCLEQLRVRDSVHYEQEFQRLSQQRRSPTAEIRAVPNVL
jgi:hypothetical protein